MKNVASPRNIIKALLVLTAAIVFVASCMQQQPRLAVTITSSEPPPLNTADISDKKFETFDHKIPKHKEFECASCHRREGRSVNMEFPAHDSCIGCHLNQFVDQELADKSKTMCSICHTAAPPAMINFPTKFKEGFNMKFDHGDHDSGAGKPAEGCASCHRSAGSGKTIPIGFEAHNNCYSCHTAESTIGSSCSTCHAIAPYRRTLPSQYNFRYIFRHDDHGPAQGVSCNECHNVNAGAPQGRQISSIAIKQHFSSSNCASCHNGRRAFPGNNMFAVQTCARCHKDFVTALPPGTVPDIDAPVE